MLAAERELTEDEILADEVAHYWDDPLGFVMFAYPWDTDTSIQICKLPAPWCLHYDSEFGPDAWACEFLEDLGRRIKQNNFDGSTPVEPIREAIASGHGIGKSALIAWICDFIMSTRPLSVGTVTANTAPQLETKTWAEIAKWTKKCITGHWFDVTTGRGSMKMVCKFNPENWKCTAQTCVKENSEAFAGQHAPTGTSFYLFDEASAIEDIIDVVSEGGLSDGEPMKFAFGNPTRNSGWFKATAQSKRWHFRSIDSRDVAITNKKLIAEMIDDYGVDSDRVKVRVRGMFPAQSVRQFISTADVDAATKVHLRVDQYNFAPRILTLDNCWEGDDEGVIGLRQGLRFEVLRTFARNDNDVDVARLLADLEDEHHADAVFIDAGYGTGVVSVGRSLGRNWQLVWFGAAAPDKGYANMRAWIWAKARDWLKAGGAIDPKDTVLYNDLIGPETISRVDGKVQLEAKKDMKARGIPSPGRGDALALSFAFPVAAKALVPVGGARQARQGEYDPFANLQG